MGRYIFIDSLLVMWNNSEIKDKISTYWSIVIISVFPV